jgi:hypothetical protein
MDNFELQIYSLIGYAIFLLLLQVYLVVVLLRLQRRGFEANPKSGKTGPESAARLRATEGGRTRRDYSHVPRLS